MLKPFVEAFLKVLREATGRDGLQMISRASNNQALIDLGLTPKLREEAILNLQAENYAQRPLPDDQGCLETFGFFAAKSIAEAEKFMLS